MNAAQVKIKLIERNLRVTDLARRWNRPMSTVSLVVNRKLKSAALERKLALAIGVSVEELRGGNGEAA